MKKHNYFNAFADQFGAQIECVGDFLLNAAKTYPDNGITVIKDPQTEEFTSFSALLEQAKFKLAGLNSLGIGRGDTIILTTEEPIDFFVILWACVLGGIVCAPSSMAGNSGKESYRDKKIARIWNTLGQPFIIIDSLLGQDISTDDEGSPFAHKLLQYKDVPELRSDMPLVATHLDDPVVIQFSSGSTGDPKGVVLTNRNIITNCIHSAARLDLDPATDKCITWIPHFHDLGLFTQHFTAVLSKNNIVKMSPYLFLRKPYLFLKKTSEHKATWSCITNFGVHWLNKNVKEDELKSLDLSSMRTIINAAEPISLETTQTFNTKFTKCGLEPTAMAPSYGLAEATVGVSFTQNRPFRFDTVSRQDMLKGFITNDFKNGSDQLTFVRLGHSIGGVEFRVVDDQGDILAEKRVGEIQIKGENVTKGYYGHPEFEPSLFEGNWLKTGDLGYIVDGELVITGRIKDVIIIGGQNYYSNDIEAIIVENKIVETGDLAVVGIFNHEIGEEEIVTFVKSRKVSEAFFKLEAQIRTSVIEMIGVYISKIIPVKAIPKTTSGKVRRFSLKSSYLSGEFEDTIHQMGAWQRPALNGLDKSIIEDSILKSLKESFPDALADIDSDITKLDFKELGITSLQQYLLLNNIQNRLNVVVPVEVFKKCTNVRETIDSIFEFIVSEKNNFEVNNHTNLSKDCTQNKRAAITGISFRLPGAANRESLWKIFSEGRSQFRTASQKRAELSGQEFDFYFSELEDIDCFDYEFFGLSHDEAKLLDPQMRLTLQNVYHALEDACVITAEDHEIDVFSVSSPSSYANIIRKLAEENNYQIDPNAIVGLMSNMIAAMVSKTFNLTGKSLHIDTACSSFSVAIYEAVQSICSGAAKGGIVTGSNIILDQHYIKLLSNAGILSSEDNIYVYDDRANGTLVGEGVISFYLEDYETAKQLGKHSYAVIDSVTVNNDGQSLSMMAPNPRGQSEVIRKAYLSSKTSIRDVSYIEGHGTGTAIGDPVELNAVSKEIQSAGRDIKIKVGSAKANFGHLLSAASAVSILKILMQYENRQFTPMPNFVNWNPNIQSKYFDVLEHNQDFPEGAGVVPCGVNSYGFGGTNSHIILENVPKPIRSNKNRANMIFAVSAKSIDALNEIISDVKKQISTSNQIDDLAYTYNKYRPSYQHKLGLVVGDGKFLTFIPQAKASSKLDIFISDEFLAEIEFEALIANPLTQKKIEDQLTAILGKRCLSEDLKNLMRIQLLFSALLEATISICGEKSVEAAKEFMGINSVFVSPDKHVDICFGDMPELNAKYEIPLQQSAAFLETVLAIAHVNSVSVNWDAYFFENKPTRTYPYPFRSTKCWV